MDRTQKLIKAHADPLLAQSSHILGSQRASPNSRLLDFRQHDTTPVQKSASHSPISELMNGEGQMSAMSAVEMQLQSNTPRLKSRMLDLQARLYDNAERSQVIMACQGRQTQSDSQFISRMPVTCPAPAIKTTLFKSDYLRRKRELMAKRNPELLQQNYLTVEKLHRPRPPSVPRSPPASQIQSSLINHETVVSMETGKMETPDSAAPESPDDRPRKMVKFTSSSVTQSTQSQATGSDGSISTDTPLEIRDQEQKYPGEIPIVDKDILNHLPERRKATSAGLLRQQSFVQENGTSIQRVSSSGSKLQSRHSFTSLQEPGSDAEQNKPPLAQKSASDVSDVTDQSRLRAQSAGQVGRKQDPGLVLMHLRKNTYDDEEPENADPLFHIKRMREKLGWTCDIPRHGPGCKDSMEKLVKKEAEQDEAKFEDDGEFIYALQANRENKRARFNPYDLQVVSANTARSHKIFWTISASRITRCCFTSDSQDDSTVTPILWWLWEKRLFDSMFELPVFVKFRMWKTFKMWKKNVRQNKNIKSRSVLCKTLHFANEILQGCILHVRGLCEAACADVVGRGQATISLVTVDRSVTMSLSDFMAGQKEQCRLSLDKLSVLRFNVVHILYESCSIICEMEGITAGMKAMQAIAEHSSNGEKGGKKPKKPLYAQIAEWRKVLLRLARFLRTVDYLLLDMLRRIVVTAMKDLLTFIISSFSVPEDSDTGQKRIRRKRRKNKPEKVVVYNIIHSHESVVNDQDLFSSDSGDEPELECSVHSGSDADDENDEIDDNIDDDNNDNDNNDGVGSNSPTFDGTRRQSKPDELALKSTSGGPGTDSKQIPGAGQTRPGTNQGAGTGLIQSGYVIPQFDFDQVEENQKIPDIDDVLDEIKQSSAVIENIKPIFNIDLVLNVPMSPGHIHQGVFGSTTKFDPDEQIGLENNTDGMSDGDTLMQPADEDYDDDDDDDQREPARKSVSFLNEKNMSGSDLDASSSDDDENHGKDEANRFAYQEDGTRREFNAHVYRSFISLLPSAREFRSGIMAIISGFEDTVGQMTSMLREPRLARFYSPPSYDLKLNYDQVELLERREMQRPWPDTEFLFGEDVEYQELYEDINSYVEKALVQVSEYAKSYNQFCQMVDRSRRVDVEGSMDKRSWSTDEFNHALAVHSEMKRYIDEIVVNHRVTMMHVLVEKFQRSVLPFPSAVIDSVHKRLPVIASKRNEDLQIIIKSALKKLDHHPESVEDFVNHLSFLAKMSAELGALSNEFDTVNKLYAIAQDYEVHIIPEDFAMYQTLGPSFQHLKSTILFCEAKKEENIRQFSTDLETLIKNIRFTSMELKNRVRDPSLLNGDTIAVIALEMIRQLQEEVHSLSAKARSYANYQERFGSSMAQSKRYADDFMFMSRRDDKATMQAIQNDLSDIERDLTLRRLLWESSEEWNKLTEEWTATTFDSLNVESLQKNVNRFTQTVYMLEKGLPVNECVPRVKDKVMNFKSGMPVITSMRNPSLRPRHWEVIEKLIGKSIIRDKTFTLGNLMDMNILKHKDRIQDISTTASNEATLEIMLQKVIDLWQTTDFRLVPHPSRDTHILSGADDILTQLEESQVTIGTIRGSRYVSPIKHLVEEWERKLQAFSRTLDEWLTCQRNWLHLEQIFNTPDIQRQLPSEFKLFTQVDKSWKDQMRRVEDRPNALKSAIAPGTLETLQSANANLEKIQKCLEDYLETKRLVFPRFYFLSNDELLDILAQSKDPNAVQPHLVKCFGNIKSLDIKQLPRQPATVRSMQSAEGEVLSMPRNIRARGAVEQWLGGVENGMYESVKKFLKMGLSDRLGIGLKDWVLRHPGQVVLTVCQVVFNKDVMKCFEQFDPVLSLRSVAVEMVTGLNMLASMVTLEVMSHQRMSIEALMTISVHNRDIVSSLIDKGIDKKEDFEWTRQLRYEWDEQTNNCQVLQSNATFQYGYEYLGCSPRLVITPLTDRCYLTLTGALHLHLGGSPAGPAGTGKTETVKDLAKAMGKQCVVFNCSEGLDYKMLGKFFSGLAQSGSWCCFDEFNRIDIEVLSVVAQQIHTIKAGKNTGAPRFVFEGRDIRLNFSCAYFITMNPTYAGRVELPDNLKSLFRPVAMMVPDYVLIAEIMLFSEGFIAAKPLSRKLVNLYQLASKQLSQQDHYDFGMRAIKSVLVMAGHSKRHAMTNMCSESSTDDRQIMTEEQESYILIHSLRDANLPKFLAEDVPLFESIMSDLFPGIVPPDQDQGAIERSISMAIRDLDLQHWPSQIEKVKQFYNQLLVRHGIMLVGPTGGGKSAIRQILQRALVLLPTLSHHDSDHSTGSVHSFVHNRTRKGHVDTFMLNPKCVKLGELYGETDPNTFEWTDGLIASATRKFAKALAVPTLPEDRPSTGATMLSEFTSATEATSIMMHSETSYTPIDQSVSMDHDLNQEQQKDMDATPTDWQWIILDGPVDTLWVENLNTVLDDSKVLCLANGERISLSPGMRMIFEVDNLSKASPATISRCAMVYMDPVDLGWRPFVKTWLHRLPKDIPESSKQHLNALFEYAVDRGYKFVKQHYKHQLVIAPDMSVISMLCNILSAYFDFMAKNCGFGKPDKEEVRPDSASSEGSRTSSRQGSRPKKKTQRKMSRQLQSKEMLAKENDIFKDKKPQMMTTKQWYLQKNPDQLPNLLGKLFVFAFTWGFGGNLQGFEDYDDEAMMNRGSGSDKSGGKQVNICAEFDNFMRELFEVEGPLGVRIPAGNRPIYGYFVDLDTCNFIPWDQLIPSTKSLIEKGAIITIGETLGLGGDQSKKSSSYEADIVPTVDNVRFAFLTGLLLLNKHPVLLTGESGVGKTAMLTNMLKRLSKDGGTGTRIGTILGNVFNFAEKSAALLENISNLTRMNTDDGEESNLDLIMGTAQPKLSTGLISSMIQCSAQTTSSRMQAQIMYKLVKKGRDTLGAPRGRKVLVFVDDMNMPAPDEYGTQAPLELLRQFIEFGGFYDTKKLVWKEILDVTLVAAMGPPGGGRNPVSTRLLKNFSMLSVPQPSTRSLQHIYQVQLGSFIKEGDFMPDVTELLFPLISASIAIYYRMCFNMLPTPAKSHYTFNIRDLSKVINGLQQAHSSVIVSRENCIWLFVHEVTRIFHDRLVDEQDRDLFFNYLSDNLHDHFKMNWSANTLLSEQALFGDFFEIDETDTGMADDRVYRSIHDRKKLSQILDELYMRMNLGNTSAPEMVFFNEAVEHIVRAVRVFRQPGGHMMLVGIDGTGKSTLVRIAAYIAGCEIFQLTLHRNYNIDDFHDDLKKLYNMTGLKSTKTVFLLTDSDIVQESFLEDINCILNSGDVPDLFDNEELDGIAMEIKNTSTEVADTRDAVYQFFIQRVCQKLHVVLTMSPAGGRFRQRCRMNPALINCCTIDWYNEWSSEAMLSVAELFFQNENFIADDELEANKSTVAGVCVNLHKSVQDTNAKYLQEMRRNVYSTPSNYLELIKLYSRFLKENNDQFQNNKERLLIGLYRLSEANSLVESMKEELVSLGPKIEEKARDTEDLLKQLEKDSEAVKEVQAIVAKEETIMQKETIVVQNYADECEKDLASVLPALQKAISSLDALDKASIAEIRVYTKPPELVMTVLAGVCILFQRKADWTTAKLMLSDPSFLKMLVQFDKNNLPEKVFTKLKRYSKHPDFNPDTVGKVSMACRCICEWVLALEHYNDVYTMVRPKQDEVKKAREALQMAQDNLSQKQHSLKKIQDHLAKLEDRYQDSVNQREGLKEKKEQTRLRLQRASVLINALAGEKVRWSESVEELDSKLTGLMGDTLISAASVAYLGPFTTRYRHQLTQTWSKMCCDGGIAISSSYNPVKNMADANEVLRWQNEGLPRDSHSTENALFMKKGLKWPLLIDPQGQAEKWIKQMEGSPLKIISAQDVNYMRTMERAIRVGEPVLLKGVSEILDPSLKPILLQETFFRGGHRLMKLGDTEIEYNDNFRLYLSTSLANPHYLPSVFNTVIVINFTVTFDGLKEQLLSVVVSQERPHLEKQRTKLLQSLANDKQKLRDLEDTSLSLLQKAKGNILDDQELVDTLQSSKTIAAEIYHRVAESEDTEKRLSLARQRYLPVATRGAVLYFVVSDLTGIDVMYQFSLTWFQTIFTGQILPTQDKQPPSISRSRHISGTLRPADTQQQRDRDSNVTATPRPQDSKSDLKEMSDQDMESYLHEMTTRLTSTIYRVVSLSMFAHHQLTLSFLLCTSILRKRASNLSDGDSTDHVISELEWQVFLQANVLISAMDSEQLAEHDGLTAIERLESQGRNLSSVTAKEVHSPPAFITEVMWHECQLMEAKIPSAFEKLCRSLISNHEQWDEFHISEEPYVLMRNPYTLKIIVPDEVPTKPEVLEWEKLSSFQRLLLVKVLSPETLTSAIRHFVEDELGASYLSAGTFDLKTVYDDSNARSPLIFILSPDSDPASQLLRFAKELRGSALHLDMISLGRGQGPRAEELISKAQILKGRWVFLQNCHLAASWMPKLQQIVESFSKKTADVDLQFRLWLSSKPDPNFPVSILQAGLKMTIESPQGLKANLQRSFGSSGVGIVSERSYEDASATAEWRNLLFGLCLFNGVIHERKKYGALGWNIPYGFNDSDLEVSILQLRMLLDEQQEIPWTALTYLTGEVTYGGRVTDEWDRRCLHSLLCCFYTPDVLEDNYSYSPNKVYAPPAEEWSFTDVVAYIEALPDYDAPEIFGMTDNAEKAFREHCANRLIDTVRSVQPRTTTQLPGVDRRPDAIVLETIDGIMSQLPETVENLDDKDTSVQASKKGLKEFILRDTAPSESRSKKSDAPREQDEISSQIEDTLSRSALINVLRQEIDRFNNLLNVIHVSLRSLRLAVKGDIVMSEQLEDTYSALLQQKVPAQWEAMSYGSLKTLGAWTEDLTLRVEFFSAWADQLVTTVEKALKQSRDPRAPSAGSLENNANFKLQPRSFWLPAFFFPQGFLMAVLQTQARKMSISVDSLTFDFTVMASTNKHKGVDSVHHNLPVNKLAFQGKAPPEEGVLVFGLYLDGACWDSETGTLQDSPPGERFAFLPEVHFLPVQESSKASSHEQANDENTPSDVVEDENNEEEDNDGKDNDEISSEKGSDSSQSTTGHLYECPLYRTSARAGTLSSTGLSSNFVSTVNLPSTQPADFWVMRGVALLCQLDQ